MNVHEYQAKEILARFGVPVQKGRIVFTPEEAEAAARELGSARVVVKAQIHAGGRGKGGGVKLAGSPQEAREFAAKMLGMQLVTHQTGPEGKRVEKVLISEAVEIRQELYLAMTLDRASSCVTVIASREGGVEIRCASHVDTL